MDEKLLVAMIAAGSSMVGVVVSSAISFFLGRRAERQKSRFSAAEYIQHKIESLERCREHLFTEGQTFQVTKKTMADALAKVAEQSLKSGTSVFLRAAHYLPVAVASELRKECEILNATLSRGRAKRHGIEMEHDPKTDDVQDGGDLVRRMASFSGRVAEEIEAELERCTRHIDEIYQLKPRT